MTPLQKGDKAPSFSGTDQDGKEIELKDYKGKKLILFFYPKDNTPTCTTEVCNLRDNYENLRKHGFDLLGVSPDSERKHRNFIKKFDLPFPLIADKDKTVLNAYGVWGPKKMFGNIYDGVYRTTFVIDENQNIVEVFTKVTAKDHAAQILGAMGLQ